MKLYKKPVITLDYGVAEGIYAASGATTNTFSVSDGQVTANWGNSGQCNFTLDLSSLEGQNIKLSITFNMPISSGWGGGFSTTVDGSTLILTNHSAPSSAEITVQANGNITALAAENYAVLDAHNN